jgi:Uma2 family endonuclease
MMLKIPFEQKITYAEYLDWGNDVICEALDGQIINMTPSPTPNHQDVLAELLVEFRLYLRNKKCKAFPAPIDVCLFAKNETPHNNIKDWVQPDLVVVCDDNKIDEKRIIGAPELIIEILSPTTAKYDRVIKLNKYEKAGVQEYWIVDPYNQSVDVFFLQDKLYIHKGVYFRDEQLQVFIFHDFNINLSNIFNEKYK